MTAFPGQPAKAGGRGRFSSSLLQTMGDRITFVLACSACKNKNYHFARGKKQEYKVEVKKFCKACGKQTVHKEAKS